MKWWIIVLNEDREAEVAQLPPKFNLANPRFTFVGPYVTEVEALEDFDSPCLQDFLLLASELYQQFNRRMAA
jgi:hypothetical protein